MNKKTEKLNRYQQGKIYKITSNETDKCYIGSTCEKYLCNRMANHRSHLKKYNAGKALYITANEIVKYHDSKIILLEAYECKSKDELLAREQHYIDTVPNNINKRRSHGRDLVKYKEYQKKYSVAYLEKNKEENKKRCAEYRQKLKEKINI
jgi:hypothetical protein